MNVKIKRLHPGAVIPRYATAGAAGFDLVAVEDVIIEPGETKTIRTGLAFEIPEGFEMQIRMRSGIAKKTKLRLPNSVATIDSDYRGEVVVMLENTAVTDKFFDSETGCLVEAESKHARTIDDKFYKTGYIQNENARIIRKGDRIAQAVISPVMRVQFEEVAELSETERGNGGFGSTGIREGE